MADDYIWPQYSYGFAVILAQLGRYDDALAPLDDNAAV
jgi:hypothetical protein